MKNKRLVSLWICAMMLCGLLPVGALAGAPASTATLDLTDGSIVLEADAGGLYYTQGSGNKTYYTGSVKITGSMTANTVTVQSGTHNVILSGVTIQISLTDFDLTYDFDTIGKFGNAHKKPAVTGF